MFGTLLNLGISLFLLCLIFMEIVVLFRLRRVERNLSNCKAEREIDQEIIHHLRQELVRKQMWANDLADQVDERDRVIADQGRRIRDSEWPIFNQKKQIEILKIQLEQIRDGKVTDGRSGEDGGGRGL